MAVDLAITVIRHFFPFLGGLVAGLSDPREAWRCTYSVKHLYFLALSLFLFQVGSRRQLRQERLTDSFRDNLNLLSGGDEEQVADPDTMAYLFAALSPDEVGDIAWRMAGALIRGKTLDSQRFDGSFLVAVDATEIAKYKQPHCPTCLTRTHKNGTTDYFHAALEAKLVTASGLVFSMATEFIENPEGDYVKQDCERKAFPRLAAQLKGRFKRLPICLLGDSLYPCGPVLDIIAANRWGFILNFKKGSLPKPFAAATGQIARHPENTARETDADGKVWSYSWAHNIRHGEHVFHVVFAETGKRGPGEFFVFITHIRPGKDNVAAIVDKGGRNRWKIENQGFNAQKNHGFELESRLGGVGDAWKNFYHVVQCAHTVFQLVAHGDLFGKLARKAAGEMDDARMAIAATLCLAAATALDFYKSGKNLARRMLESFRREPVSAAVRDPGFAASIQIRVNSS